MNKKMTYRDFSQVVPNQIISFHNVNDPTDVFVMIVSANKPSNHYDFCITLSDGSVHSFNLRKDNFQYEDAIDMFNFYFCGDKYYGVIQK